MLSSILCGILRITFRPLAPLGGAALRVSKPVVPEGVPVLAVVGPLLLSDRVAVRLGVSLVLGAYLLSIFGVAISVVLSLARPIRCRVGPVAVLAPRLSAPLATAIHLELLGGERGVAAIAPQVHGHQSLVGSLCLICGFFVPRAQLQLAWLGRRLPGSSASSGLFATGYMWSTVKDRKSTRLNSSHVAISYAVFCLK